MNVLDGYLFIYLICALALLIAIVSVWFCWHMVGIIRKGNRKTTTSQANQGFDAETQLTGLEVQTVYPIAQIAYSDNSSLDSGSQQYLSISQLLNSMSQATSGSPRPRPRATLETLFIGHSNQTRSAINSELTVQENQQESRQNQISDVSSQVELNPNQQCRVAEGKTSF